MSFPLTCAPTGIPLDELRGVTDPVAETVRTMSMRTIGAVRNDGPFFPAAMGSLSPQPDMNASAATPIHPENTTIEDLLISSPPL